MDEKQQIRNNFENLLREYFYLRIEIQHKLDLYYNLEKRLKTYRAMGFIDDSVFDIKLEMKSDKRN